MIQRIFERTINGEKLPKEWIQAYLTSIFKKGERKKYEKYRGIGISFGCMGITGFR